VGVKNLFFSGTVLFLALLFGCTAIGSAPLTDLTTDSADAKKARVEVESVIRQQLDAFKRDDYTVAFSFVSRAFRQEFPRDRFETMIRARFKEIARPSQATVRRIRFDQDQTRAVVEIDVAGTNARLAAVEYRMVFEEGRWKIDHLESVDPFRHL
jgi:hypothetical protein